jgi:predicted nuclease of predicted toxin-antitoxin system
MRFLVDNSLSWRLADWLRNNGHDALHVREIQMRDAEDGAIYDRACADSRVITTQDVDFSTLLWGDTQHRDPVSNQ